MELFFHDENLLFADGNPKAQGDPDWIIERASEMYKELSHPQGEISRWEKVLKRLALLNKYYPIHNDKCYEVNFMRDFKGKQQLGEDIYDIIKNPINGI